MRPAKKYMLTLTFLMILTLPVFGQPEDPDAPTPFGLVELLLGAGAFYGARAAHRSSKK